MAHEIYEHDSFVSYNGEVAWHGLGNVIAGYPTLEEAWANSGMNWEVRQFELEANIFGNIVKAPDKFMNVRMNSDYFTNPKPIPLGIVGSDYKVVQNKEHWDGFVVPYAQHTNSKIETTGTLRNGRMIWFLLKNGEVEYVKNDVIHEYFLLASSHDGSLCTTIMNTPIRVVCNNTLSAAINGCKNAYKVRHFANHQIKIEEIKKAMGFGTKFREKFDQVMESFVNLQMTSDQIHSVLDEKIFPKPIQEINPELILTMPMREMEKIPLRTETMRQNRIEKVMELVETGMGTDIPGVRGTAYGLYQAVTEYYDHYGQTRKEKGDERSDNERKFESAMFGNALRGKEQAMNSMLSLIQ